MTMTKIRKTDDSHAGKGAASKKVQKRKFVPDPVQNRTFVRDVLHSLIPDKLLKQFSDKL